ncbi:MAG: 2-phospho-L-lactate guanylyltransferase, partial [Methanobrevibacter sp.]|nr:2-phospho-L-lactate guanylyltransferase [Methanobrevibacter sp.]
IHTRYEGFSYKEHVQAAERKKLNPQVHDSFFMALDVNTAEDLGEIMIHGEKTHTRKYLKELKVQFEPSREITRINVTRG